jgi:nucleoside-diphosphate-sugar epimerase
MAAIREVLVTGGAGYVGAVLVPKLLAAGYRVRVLDLFLFGSDVFDCVADNPHLLQIKGDIRGDDVVRRAVDGCDAVIHLACISNDPSFELDPELGRSINFDAFEPLVRLSKQAGVQRFVYASSSSVYGVSEVPDVTEDHPLVPLTDYSKYKALCEPVLLDYQSPDFTTLILRPATVCGYSPRQRLDLTVNILTNHAVNNRRITVFGGTQLRPNIHVEDMADLYVQTLRYAEGQIAGKIFNAGYQNHSVAEIAQIVRGVVQREVPSLGEIDVVTTPSDDLRSYQISSDKIAQELGFVPHRTVEDAVRDLVGAFQAGKLPNAMTDERYYNIKTMQHVDLRVPALQGAR